MRRIAIIATMAAMLVNAPVAAAKTKLTPEQQLARVLDGRVAGEPVNCINQLDTRDSQVIDKTAIVYGTGSVIYVNRPTNAELLDSDDILVTVLHTSQLCSVDTIQLRDRASNFYTGFVGLNKFVPYRKVDAKS